MAFLRPINKNKKGNAQKWTAVHKLFTELAPKYAQRAGGYTRVIRSGKRDGDNAQMAIIQFVEAEVAPKEQKRKRRKVARAETKPAEKKPTEKKATEKKASEDKPTEKKADAKPVETKKVVEAKKSEVVAEETKKSE